MNSFVVGFLLFVLPLLAATTTTSVAAAEEEKIGPGVRDAVASGNGATRVLIALDDAAARQRRRQLLLNGPGVDDNDDDDSCIAQPFDSEIQKMQDDVIAATGGMEPQVLLKHVPAMSSDIITVDALDALEANPNVLRVDLDSGGQGSLESALAVTMADDRHFLGNTGQGVVVAVLDTGIDTNHPDLQANLIHEACFTRDGSGNGRCPNGSMSQTGPGSSEDDAGHGTFVSGVVASNGQTTGVAPDASLVSIRMMYGPNFAGEFSSTTQPLQAIDYIVQNPQLGVRVINMSFGTFALFTGDCSFTSYGAAMASAIATLRSRGVIATASTANNGSTSQQSWPACVPGVIAVGNSLDNDSPASSTNSNQLTSVFAPGTSITSSRLGGGITTGSGTSFAAPHVAGCAALFMQAGDAFTADEVETRIKTSAFTVTHGGRTFPRIDCSPDGRNETMFPTAVCAPRQVSTDPGECFATGVSIDAGSTDPSGVFRVEQSPSVQCPFAAGETTKTYLRVTNAQGLSSKCSATITVTDDEKPTLDCNLPKKDGVVAPNDSPVTIQGLATDNCEKKVSAKASSMECFKFNPQGKRIDVPCHITMDDATPDSFTVNNTGGVGTHIQWTLDATDGNGNTATKTCKLVIANPGNGNENNNRLLRSSANNV